MTSHPTSTFILLERIDIPSHLADVAPATAAEARTYRKALATVALTPNPVRDTPIFIRLEPSGRYTAVAGVRRVLIARRAGVKSILATVEAEASVPFDFVAIAAERWYGELRGAGKQIDPRSFGRVVSLLTRLLQARPPQDLSELERVLADVFAHVRQAKPTRH